jgi:hypothetical protein
MTQTAKSEEYGLWGYSKEEKIEMETELFHKLKQCYHTAVDLELDDLADAIDKAEHELEKVITKHPELS